MLQQHQQQQQQQLSNEHYHHQQHQQQNQHSFLPGHIMLSELPEPPIPVSEIGPIPPPPMFSTPSPTLIAGRPHGPGVNMQCGMHGGSSMNDNDYEGKYSGHNRFGYPASATSNNESI
jgi:hypothetical protein